MKNQTLAEKYKSFMKRQTVTDTDTQRDADMRFLQLVMPSMQYPVTRLAQVLQKYSLNRVITNYGKKLVKEAEKEGAYLKEQEKMINHLYPIDAGNRF